MAKKIKVTQDQLQAHSDNIGKYLLVEVTRNLGSEQPTKGVRGIVKGVRPSERTYAVCFPFESFATDDMEASGKLFKDGMIRIISFDDVEAVGRHNGW